MKNSLFLFFLMVGVIATAQKNTPIEVPLSVQSGFEKLYGTATPKWERERHGFYEAEFIWEGKPASATFNANGLLMRTEEEVPKAKIPGDIIKHAKKLYPDYEIVECAKITTPDKKLMYEVEIVKDKKRRSLIFDINNTYLREEMDEDDDDKDFKKTQQRQ